MYLYINNIHYHVMLYTIIFKTYFFNCEFDCESFDMFKIITK